MAYLCEKLEYHIIEIPIHFEDRRIGQSKLDIPVKFESGWRTWQIRWRYRHLHGRPEAKEWGVGSGEWGVRQPSAPVHPESRIPNP